MVIVYYFFLVNINAIQFFNDIWYVINNNINNDNNKNNNNSIINLSNDMVNIDNPDGMSIAAVEEEQTENATADPQWRNNKQSLPKKETTWK